MSSSPKWYGFIGRECGKRSAACATPNCAVPGRPSGRVTFWCHMAAPSATVVVPGEPLSGMLRPGEGSFVWSDGKVRASVIGSISLQGVQPAKKKVR